MTNQDDNQNPQPLEPETPVVVSPEPERDAFDDFANEEHYGYRPAEFRPAVFIPAHPPHHTDAPHAVQAAQVVPAVAATAAHAEPAGWSHTFTRVAEELVAWMKTVVSAAVYATLIVTFGFQVARVEGQSMVPTLEDQDRLIVNKWTYRWNKPRVGDVVMLYYPEEPEKSFVKRVVAEPGDSIRSEVGKVYRNDLLLNDDFIPEEFRSGDSWGPYVVKKGYYFVMGDHRNNSSDSRTWGEVPERYIIGKVQVRWWPLNHMKIF